MPKYPIDKLITDFDETISERDTISTLVHTAADNRAHEKEEFLAAWQEMVQWFLTRYHRVCDAWQDHRHSLVDYLKSFEELETVSIQRVIAKGFLQGLTSQGLRAVGRNVVKKPGANRVLSVMRADGVAVEILSANWSEALIQGATEGLCDRIITNSLQYDAAGRSTGHIHLHIVSAQDKLRKFRARKKNPPRPDETGDGGIARTLYIGDSISDFLAILDADLGVLIGQDPTAMQTIERFRLPIQRLQEGTQFDSSQRYRGTILLVDSWKVLEAFLSTTE
ncbi:haloacid dehalogenase-like hydrolase [Candidatus Poribacteria bacterium]|nr:haloacid dehalogenase-like hydrolase [Candidatus Poribacteria bacterium]